MGFSRRSFLKFVAGGAVGTLFTPFPWKIADDISIWTQNWPWIPKVPKGRIDEKDSFVKLGGPEYGIKVKLVRGRPILAFGHEENWLSEGGIDPIGASCVNLLYSPSRVKVPLKNQRNGKLVPISWDQAKNEVLDWLNKAKKDTAVICGDETGSTLEIFGILLSRLGSNGFYFMPSDKSSYHKTLSLLNI